jgi:hypothetical protein
MPNFAGLRGTGSFGTDERPKSFREMILWLNPNGSAPLYALTAKGKTEPVDDPEFAWWEETNTIVRLNVTPAIASTVTTTIVVTSGALALNVGDVLQQEAATEAVLYTPELMRVTAIASDTSFTVQRGVAGSTPINIPDNAKLTRVGNAQSEGNTSIAANSSNPTKYINYCQIFKTPYQITKTALATKFRTGDPKKNEQKRKSFIHSEKIEQAMFWGRAFETTDASNGNLPLRFTGGLRSYITTNNTIFGVAVTEDTFLAAVYPVFDYEAGGSGNERIMFMGNSAMNVLNKLARGSNRINFDQVVDFYGMKLSRWIIPQGTLYIKSHPLMNVHPYYTKSAFVVNPMGVKVRPLRGRDTKLETNIQPNDADYIKDQWITEVGFEFEFERTFAYLGNMT